MGGKQLDVQCVFMGKKEGGVTGHVIEGPGSLCPRGYNCKGASGM